VSPARGRRGELRFRFQEVVLLRAAAGLAEANVSSRVARRALARLREQLPEGHALASVAIAADGRDVVVSDGRARWHPATGQAVLDFEVREVASKVARLTRKAAPDLGADDWYRWGCDLEDGAPARAREAYLRATSLDPGHADAHLNLGRLLHESGDVAAAEAAYRRALAARPDDATGLFNLGVALDDQGRLAEALEAYGAALARDPGLADARANAVRVCERLGRKADSIRHLQALRAMDRR
jgi:tetratricopeptide (TPR) repeat protein